MPRLRLTTEKSLADAEAQRGDEPVARAPPVIAERADARDLGRGRHAVDDARARRPVPAEISRSARRDPVRAAASAAPDQGDVPQRRCAQRGVRGIDAGVDQRDAHTGAASRARAWRTVELAARSCRKSRGHAELSSPAEAGGPASPAPLA